ncbi:MAG: type IV pilus twitching motility protein PilT [Anaerolineae bacterium]|nr:MAG: type IV pilus twitching motility protein PilT [Anaerolineae bacterium]
MQIDELLRIAVQKRASDLHVRAGAPPILRIHGDLIPIGDGHATALSPEETTQAFKDVTREGHRQDFAATRELDFHYEVPNLAHFRVNASVQRGSISLAFRRIGLEIPSIEELNLPSICGSLTLKPRGLILVTGPTGSGKSTTLAAMIQHLNQHDARVVVTIEDPIEYLHEDRRCVIMQREVGRDTESFARALRSALRQDVDVILVGEMRDPETMAACLTAAETGHLVMSTLHTSSASMTIDRVIDVFPPHQQDQIRMQLSLTLEAVLSQILLPRIDVEGRVPAVEVMLSSTAVRNLIREGKTHQMPNVIQTSSGAGMQSLEQSLNGLLQRNMITMEGALATANDPEALKALVTRG